MMSVGMISFRCAPAFGGGAKAN